MVTIIARTVHKKISGKGLVISLAGIAILLRMCAGPCVAGRSGQLLGGLSGASAIPRHRSSVEISVACELLNRCENSYAASGGTPCASHLMTDSVQSARKAARDVALEYSRNLGGPISEPVGVDQAFRTAPRQPGSGLSCGAGACCQWCGSAAV